MIAAIFALGVLAIMTVVKGSGEKRTRAEIRILEIIKTDVLEHVEAGRVAPTSWATLSNSAKWELIVGISEYNQLPSPPEVYTMLSQSVTGRHYFGAVFLVRSKPYKRPAAGAGRWALTASSNHVKRIWIPEQYLSPEIRSQLTD